MNSLCGQSVLNTDDGDKSGIEKMWDVLNEENRRILVQHIIQGHHHMICREIQKMHRSWCEGLK